MSKSTMKVKNERKQNVNCKGYILKPIYLSLCLHPNFSGDPASALISFSSPMEAESAMNSSEAVLANRFIRVFYHQDKPKVHQRLGGPLTGGLPPSLPANEDPNSPEVQKQKELQKAAVS